MTRRQTSVWLASLGCMAVLSGACAARSGPTLPAPDPPAQVAADVPSTDTAPTEDTRRAAAAEPAVALSRATVRPVKSDVSVENDCALSTVSGRPIRTVALRDPVDPSHAPSPTNVSERLLFRQLYETLVRVNCDGRLRPGLASTWRLDPTGRTWIVTLDEQARFSDGSPVTTADVVSSWSEPGRDRVLGPVAQRFIESVVPVNTRVVGITLRARNIAAPRALADPGLAVAKRRPGVAWPIGTTAFRVIAPRGVAGRRGGDVTIGLLGGSPGAAARQEPAEAIRFLVAPGRDPRDRLDERVDLLVTGDPSVLAYASTLPEFTSVPLPWLRTYVLLSPSRGPGRQSVSARSPLAPALRQKLAVDAVRGEARGADGPFWWVSSAGCSTLSPTARERSAANRGAVAGARVVFRASDPVAGDLAERLVGLTAFDDADTAGLLDTLFPTGAARLVSVGLGDAAFDLALATGQDRGYLVGLDRRPMDPCQQLQALVGRAGWLGRTDRTPATAVVPLVDTRTRAVVRRGRGGLTIDGDGVLVLPGARRAQQ